MVSFSELASCMSVLYIVPSATGISCQCYASSPYVLTCTNTIANVHDSLLRLSRVIMIGKTEAQRVRVTFLGRKIRGQVVI